MNNFQTILIAIFLAFFVFAVLIFSGAINFTTKSNTGPQGKLMIWGTFPNSVMTSALESTSSKYQNLSLVYNQKDPSTYQQDLIEAFANGKGPDLFIITPDMIIKDSNFIYKIPYARYSQRTFTDSFIDGASVYLDNDGVVAIPLVVDPIVLYYNKDILTNERIVNPPKTWNELFSLNNSLTKKENNGTIKQSMIALGQYGNVNNSKDILATLLLQNNNSIVERNGAIYSSTLDKNDLNLSVSPIEAVITFFTQFSNPSNTAYSWNGSLPSSLDMFTGSKLALYIGRASELFNIESMNPNLSFDVTQIPQIKDSTTSRTFGDIYAIAISNKSTNLTAAFQIAGELSIGENAKSFSTLTSLPPATRALIADKPSDPYLSTFFNSALISRSWPDPDKTKSNTIFKELIDNTLSNRFSPSEAVNKAQGQIQLLIKQ